MQIDAEETNMLREIKEQPRTLRETIDSAVKQADRVKGIFNTYSKGNRSSLFLVGCGTSYHAAIAAKHAFRAFADISSFAYQASEFRDFEIKKRTDVVIAFSQSGETGDVLTAVQESIKNGSTVLAITNEPKSTLAEISDFKIVTKAGKELSVPMTKTYTALLAAAFCLAQAVGPKKRDTSLQQIPKAVEDTIRISEPIIEEMSNEPQAGGSLFIIGRGPNYATALEASLKIKEAALVHAEAFPSPEFRHGPKAMLGPGTQLIAFTNSDVLDDTTVRLLEDVRSTGTRLTSIGNRSGSTIQTPSLDYYLSPIPSIVPLQLLALHIAVKKGLNPDNPRSLAKITEAT